MISSSNLHREGLNQVLGELERELLDYLWESGEATGRTIFEDVTQTRRNLYHFAPVVTREEFTKLACREAICGALKISQENTIAAIVELLAEKESDGVD